MKSVVEQAIQPAVASLMCGNISRSTLQGIGGETMLYAWIDAGLIVVWTMTICLPDSEWYRGLSTRCFKRCTTRFVKLLIPI
jgi:hypothetical protein